MSDSIKNEGSSNSSTWHTDSASHNPGLPGMTECEVCQAMLPDVTYRVDPYDEDVNNTIVMRWLCDDCRQQRADDI